MLKIKCLFGGCPRIYTDTEIRIFIDADIYIKYRRFYNRERKINNPDHEFTYCIAPDCDEIIDITYLIKNKENMAECNSNHRFCYNCRLEYEHKINECENVI